MTPRQKAILKISKTQTKLSKDHPCKTQNQPFKEVFGENIFCYSQAKQVSEQLKKQLDLVVQQGETLSAQVAQDLAKAVLSWALSKGATHFCHWFQPLTGETAEKHDSLYSLKEEQLIENFTTSQLIQGESDASSLPHGGQRSTFEARGYTSWDISSPFFLMEEDLGKTLCIPTAFVSYTGDALDKKVPLLRSLNIINKELVQFMQLLDHKEVEKTDVTIGVEQEFFLIDKNFYDLRPDLVMTGRTLQGSLSARNQQLEDHYFACMPARVLNCIHEAEFELARLGILTKTRHNEVAPGQFEMAFYYRDARLASDQNYIVMNLLRKIARKHGLVALLHERPFLGVNGSGKHVNWSLRDNLGRNLLSLENNDLKDPLIFLALIAIIVKASKDHGEYFRFAISSYSNDFRLGKNEAPPSIISLYLGEKLTQILESVDESSFEKFSQYGSLDVGVRELAKVVKHNFDRNRTSPFAFTGDKFEFRAVGASQSICTPVTVINCAVIDALQVANQFIEQERKKNRSRESILVSLIKNFTKESLPVVFNGDGYSKEWVENAKSRGLKEVPNTPSALTLLDNKKKTQFLTKDQVFTETELNIRQNVILDLYIKKCLIEFDTTRDMIYHFIFPAVLSFKSQLLQVMQGQKTFGFESLVEREIFKKLNYLTEAVQLGLDNLDALTKEISDLEHEQAKAELLAQKWVPLHNELTNTLNNIEDVIPDELWKLPKYSDMLFLI